MTTRGTYMVLGVESGERLTLLSTTSTRHEVLIAGVQVPRAGRVWATGPSAVEEPCGFDALEHIRTRCLGKPVQFEPTTEIAAIQRTAGVVTLPDRTDAALSLIQAGLARATERPPTGLAGGTHESYVKATQISRLSRQGLWSPQASTCMRALQPFPPSKPAELFAKVKDTTDKVRIERISPGGGMVGVIAALRAPVSMLLAGVRFPPSRGATADPLAEQARLATERALLHRTVAATFDGIDANGVFLVSIVGPKGVFQEELLRNGLVRFAPAINATSLEALRQAEADAKNRRVGLWVNYTPPSQGDEHDRAVPAVTASVKEGVVVAALSGDTLSVACPEGTLRIGIAGVRAPRAVVGTDRKGPDSSTTYPPCAWEARELLRKTFVGRAVQATMDPPRGKDATEGRLSGVVVTTDGSDNAAMRLVRAGLARVTFSKTDPHPASSDLLAEEAAAKSERRGLHGDITGAGLKIVELHRLAEPKARQYLSFLQRGGQAGHPARLPAIVEAVVGASVYRVYVPREHIQFALRLAGVVTPSTVTDTGVPDACAAEAKDFAVRLVQHRDVEVEISAVDRGGNFIGSVWANGQNVAVALTAAGLAVVANADRLPFGTQLAAAAREAEAAMRGLHATGSVPARARRMQEAATAATDDDLCPLTTPSSWTPVTLSEVLDGTTVCLQETSSSALQGLGEKLASLAADKPHESPAANETVAVCYGGTWCRATVRRGGRAPLVHFVDYGTVSEIDTKDVRRIPTAEAYADTRGLPPQCRTVRLAYLRGMPAAHPFSEAAANFMWDFADKGELMAIDEYTNRGGQSFVRVALQSSTTTTLNANLLQNGLGLLDKRAVALDAKQFGLLRAAQEVAHQRHSNLWQYGAADEDDEDD